MRTDLCAPLRPRLPVWLLGGLALLALACADHDDGHRIPPEVEARAQLMTLPMALGEAEYGPANWVKSPNYTPASRGKGQITTIVVHTIQGTYKGCISWFQNTSSKVSAHYVLGKNGEVTQMVKEKDIGWHVGSANGYTIGLEHEGFVTDPNWASPQMLDASAKLTCYLVKKYGLTATKTHIKGHVDLPNQTHTDPGKYWPWETYLKKVQDCVGGTVQPPAKAGCCAAAIKSTGSTILDNTGNDCIQKFGSASTWWTANDTGYGGSMNYTYTAASSWPDNWARWRLTFAKAGKYRVDVWIPAKHAGATVTYKIKHGGVVSTATVAQDKHADTWVQLGEWTFKGDCDEWVVLEDSQGVKGIQMGVDAVRLTVSGTTPQCPPSCDDGNPCTSDSCSNGQCVHSNKTGPCSDGNPCTEGDTCTAGVCKWQQWKSCGDNNPCTDDVCDQKTGVCKATANKAACSDSNPCTIGDACQGGTCQGGALKSCGDGNPCTGASCDPKTGQCAITPAGGACNDGNICTSGDQCVGGKCLGTPKQCDDGNPCTDDYCGAAGCAAKPNKMFCDDGDGCTAGDACLNGLCVGQKTACSDANPCTDDLCVGGTCSYVPNKAPCGAPTACNAASVCGGGKCVAGALTCDDADACTADLCNGGKCAHQPLEGATCEDGDDCTRDDHCAAGVCVAGPFSCDDHDPCTTDACVAAHCQHQKIGGCVSAGHTDAQGAGADASGAGEDGQVAGSDGGGEAGRDVTGGVAADGAAWSGDAQYLSPGSPPPSGCAARPERAGGGTSTLLWLCALGIGAIGWRRRRACGPTR